jgi:hypothetical protein
MNPSIVKDIGNAYNSVYYDTNNIFEDVVNYCYATDIFETLEETEYFANLIIKNELAYTFVEDVLEYCVEEQLLEESYIAEVSGGLLKAGMKVAGGLLKKVTPAVRGLPAKTLAKKGYTPGGFSATGKQLGKVNKPAFATQTRSIQQARAARKPPEPQKANKYADMLSQKKASQATAPVSKPAANALRQMTTSKVAKGAAADPWKQFPKKSAKQYGLPKTSAAKPESTKALTGSPTPKALPSAGKTSAPPPDSKPAPSSAGKGGYGLTSTVRAKLSPTEKTGNMRYPGLEKYATGSGPGTGGTKTPKKSKLGFAAAGAGAFAAGASVSPEPSKQNKPSIKTDVYNTMDSGGKVRSRKKVGSAKVGTTFEDAFKFYRKRGDKTFKYAGKDYTTKLAGESVDIFDIVLDRLLTEGYANTYEDALKIMATLENKLIDELM